MGEMCDFEAEYYPENWNFFRIKKKKKRKDVYISMSASEYASYKAIGGAVATRKLIKLAAKDLPPPPNAQGATK